MNKSKISPRYNNGSNNLQQPSIGDRSDTYIVEEDEKDRKNKPKPPDVTHTLYKQGAVRQMGQQQQQNNNTLAMLKQQRRAEMKKAAEASHTDVITVTERNINSILKNSQRSTGQLNMSNFGLTEG
jgi:hypothetical protein